MLEHLKEKGGKKKKRKMNNNLQQYPEDKERMGATAVFASIIKSTPNLARLLLSLFWIYLTLGLRVRKARKAFERQLVSQGMSKDDARRLGTCYDELKDNIVGMVKRGFGSSFRQVRQ